MFILGRLYCGKKQPEFMYSFALNLSTEPNSCTSPSGSTIKAIDGLDIWFERQVGTASITPPTRQNACRYSAQLWYNGRMGITAFFGKNLVNMSMIYSMSASPIWIGFLRKFASGFTWSMFRYAWPLPLNSSSILKSHVCTYKLLAINLASDIINSYSS